MKPLLLITGFLGAGKTTLLRDLLKRLGSLDLTADVILNDYENAEIDAATLEGAMASLVPISASCACCDSLDDLVRLCRATGDSRGDIVLVELNGTADPLPLLEAFTLLESRLGLWPRWQVGVVDARHWGKRSAFDPLERRQLETATHWVLSHDQALSESDRHTVEASVATVNPFATRTKASDLALSLSKAQQTVAMRPFRFRPAETSRQHDEVHNLTHAFTGCQIPLPGKLSHAQALRLMNSLPPQVVRAKLLARISDRPGCRWLYERVNSLALPEPTPAPEIERVPVSLVCIGSDLNPDAIRRLAENQLGPLPELSTA